MVCIQKFFDQAVPLDFNCTTLLAPSGQLNTSMQLKLAPQLQALYVHTPPPLTQLRLDVPARLSPPRSHKNGGRIDETLELVPFFQQKLWYSRWILSNETTKIWNLVKKCVCWFWSRWRENTASEISFSNPSCEVSNDN